MNRWLIVVGIACLGLAAIIWMRGHRTAAPTQQIVAAPTSAEMAPTVSQATPASSSPAPGSPSTVPTASAGPSTVASAPAEQPAPAIPLPPSTLKPSTPQLSYAAAHGRPDGLRLTIATSGPSIAVQAMPQAGAAEVLSCSTLGGVESQQWIAATWALADRNAIQVDRLTSVAGSQAGSLTLALDRRGIWTVASGEADPDLAASAIEVARTIIMLRGAFAEARAWSPGQEARLGGEPFRVIHAQSRLLLLAAVNDAQDRPALGGSYPDAGWNDAALWLDAAGAWTAAERLVGAPATRDEPGILVRRVIIRPQH